MKRAVETSGILSFAGKLASIDYIPEPEAAAIAIIPRVLKDRPLEVRPSSTALSRSCPTALMFQSLTWSRRHHLSSVPETDRSPRLATPL